MKFVLLVYQGSAGEEPGGYQRVDLERPAPPEAFRGRPPRRPFARDARALLALVRAPTSAATPTMLTVGSGRSENRATRTWAADFASGCAVRYAFKTSRIARSTFAGVSAAA